MTRFLFNLLSSIQSPAFFVVVGLVGPVVTNHVVYGQPVLRQVHVITRHGSRYPLRKNANDLSESTPGMLTAFGQKQMYDVGTWIRDVYTRNGFLDQFYPDDTRLESSSFERTITSANSLALGLFPGAPIRDPSMESLLPVAPANVPVYTYDAVNDIYLRAFDKCPTLHDRLQSLYQSEEWQRLQSNEEPFLRQLAEIHPAFHPYSDQSGIIQLEDIWNVYDAVSVAKAECSLGHEDLATCQSIADGVELRDVLSEDEWEKLQSLAHMAELEKYGVSIAGKLIGINLLLEILRRMQGDDVTFSLFSAHYATILGVFSALDEVFFSEQVIPHYAASLIFEVTQDLSTNERYFRIVYRGDDRASKTAVSVSMENICGESLNCPVSALEEFLDGWDAERWCRECGNQDANQCTNKGTQSSGSNDDDWLGHPLEFGFLIGLGVGVIGVVITLFVQRKEYQKSLKQKIGTQDQQHQHEQHAQPPSTTNYDAQFFSNSNGHQPALEQAPLNETSTGLPTGVPHAMAPSSSTLSTQSQQPPVGAQPPTPHSSVGTVAGAAHDQNTIEPRHPPLMNFDGLSRSMADDVGSASDRHMV